MSEKEVKKCHSCGVDMQLVVEAPFRIVWYRGGWKLLSGELAELGEETFPFYIYICPKCGRIESFADEETKQRLLKRSRELISHE